jgi:hypothetical protein
MNAQWRPRGWLFHPRCRICEEVPTFMRREFPEHLAKARIEDPMAKTVAEGV